MTSTFHVFFILFDSSVLFNMPYTLFTPQEYSHHELTTILLIIINVFRPSPIDLPWHLTTYITYILIFWKQFFFPLDFHGNGIIFLIPSYVSTTVFPLCGLYVLTLLRRQFPSLLINSSFHPDWVASVLSFLTWFPYLCLIPILPASSRPLCPSMFSSSWCLRYTPLVQHDPNWINYSHPLLDSPPPPPIFPIS